MYRLRLALVEQAGLLLLVTAFALLLAVLVPGIGHPGQRQCALDQYGSLQPAGVGAGQAVDPDLHRRATWSATARKCARRYPASSSRWRCSAWPRILLLLEPDFGATVVLLATALGMMFLAGVRLWQFGGMLGLGAVSLAVLAMSSPYRLERLTTFLNPWADPFNSGFQLTQSLIAIGRGEWLGVGLGASIQKLFYLPEAHTDFLFAVLAEELGLVGVVRRDRPVCPGGLARLRDRRQRGARRAMLRLLLAYGIGIWIGLQGFINMGVNMGVLPTKGLTLPLMSYGGCSMVVMCVAIALLLRIDYETRCTVEGLSASGTAAAKRRGQGT